MISDEEVQDFLEHYGVKGMRWGERRAARKAGHIDRLTRLANKEPLTRKEKNQVYRKFGITGNKQAERQLQILQKRQQRQDKTKAFVKGHSKEIAIGTAVVAGTVAAGLLLRAHQNVKVKNLRQTHEGFIKAKDLLDSKMNRRMKDLQDLAKKTPPGHPSREGALNEIKNLNTFYNAQLNKMMNRNNLDPSVLKKMKVKTSL